MDFKEAAEKLDGIAQGNYHSLKYEIVRCSKYDFFEQKCTVYINGFEHYSGTTWEEAFEKLERAMNPVKITIDDVDPIPEIEVTAA